MSVALSGTTRADVESEKLAQYRVRVDQAIDRALEFLATEVASRPPGGALFAGPNGETNAVAGLVGMAFLSKGYTPGRTRYGEMINRCADHIFDHHQPNGYLGGPVDRMYGHGISTLFLSEISGMVDPERQKKIDELLPKAVRVILDAQKMPKTQGYYAGGWRYEPTSPDSDISVTGWCLMALRSARANGAPVPTEAVDKATAYVERCRNPDGGFRYSGAPDWWYARRGYWVREDSSASRTGVALLCRELAGRHDDEINRKAADFVIARTKAWAQEGGFVEYATYYCSQGMFQLGGKYWENFAEFMYNYLLPIQKSSGMWESEQYGQAYPTAMYVLALTVSCRQLPIYQR